MTFYVENESGKELPFPTDEFISDVIKKVLEKEKCTYEMEVNILITDNAGIREYNKQFRGIDSETDVLSFPNVDYDSPADFSYISENEADYKNPETGEIVLGDIILSIDKIYSQSTDYGHSLKREFAFLIVHSMLHLLGYDHIESSDALIMEPKQEEILQSLDIKRE